MHPLFNQFTKQWKPDPDYRRLLAAIRREGDPGRAPLLELFADAEVIAAVLDEPVPITINENSSHAQWDAAVSQKVRFWHALGYDAIWQGPVLDFPGLLTLTSEDTAALSRPARSWVNEKAGRITSWKDFECYAWPRPEDADYYPMEAMARCLPEGMGILVEISGVFEPLSWLMGYETLCMALYDQPDLVEAICNRLREILLPVARSVTEMERVIGIWMGDDMGFRSGTLVSPRHLRTYIFPILKEIAALVHANGLPFLLHSCGKLEAVMDDLIDGVGIDAKHSFEDVIEPVEAFNARYSRRLAVIGGVDMDLLARGSEEAVRRRTRQVLEACTPSRAYVLGSGNSIANYIPLQNLLAMLDEGRRFNAFG